MSKMSLSKGIQRTPRAARSVMHVDPTRVQQTRKVKDCATGIFSAAKLAERKIQDAEPVAPKRQDKGRQSVAPEPLVVDPMDPYAHIRIDQNRENEENIVCDVCLDDNDEEGDEIMICEICFVGVHQTCYGGKFRNHLPPAEQPFYCERCEYLIQNQRTTDCTKVKCMYCPNIDGAMKLVGKNEFAHVVCVNWLPGIWFTDDNLKNKIGGKPADVKTGEVLCLSCKSREGATITCDFRSCGRSYHVRCATKMGLIEDWEQMDERNKDNFTPIFCNQHEKCGTKMFKEFGPSSLKCKPVPQKQSKAARKPAQEPKKAQPKKRSKSQAQPKTKAIKKQKKSSPKVQPSKNTKRAALSKAKAKAAKPAPAAPQKKPAPQSKSGIHKKASQVKPILKKPVPPMPPMPASIDVNMMSQQMAQFVQNKQPNSKVGNGKAIGQEINKMKNAGAKDKQDKNAQNPIKEAQQTKQEPAQEKPVMWQQPGGMQMYPPQQHPQYFSPAEYQNHMMMYGHQTYPPQQMMMHPGQQQMMRPPMQP